MNLIFSGQQEQYVLLLQAYFQNKSPATLRAYRQDLKNFSRYLEVPTLEQAASLLINQKPGPANLVALNFKAWLLAQGLSPNSINRKLAGLRSLVKLARTLGLITWKLELPNETTESYRDTRGPGVEAYRKMLQIAGASKNRTKALRDLAILRVLYALGLRRSSIVNLTMADLELDRKAVWVTLKRRNEKKLKTLPPTAQKALEDWLRIRGEAEGPVFTNLDRAGKGFGLTGTALYQIIRGYGEQAGVRTRPHGLRHTAITEAVKQANQNGIGIDEVLEFSDHRNLSTLMIYRDRERDVQGSLSRLIEGG